MVINLITVRLLDKHPYGLRIDCSRYRIEVKMLALILSIAIANAGDIEEVETYSEVESGMAAWGAYEAHFESENMSEHALEHGREWSCGTTVVQGVRDNWDSFTAEQQARITERLTPWKDDFMATMEPNPAPPMGNPATNTCFEVSRPSGTGQGLNRLDSEHFSVQWDDSLTQSTVQSFSDALETSWDVEVDQMDWRAPDKTSMYLILVYISNDNMGGAYTSIDRCGNDYTPYIVAGRDSFWGTWYQDMAAHEFNHAIQFAYGMANESWLWEATALWIEEYVFPSHNAWSDYITGYTKNPHLAINADNRNSNSEFLHMYGMGILNFYLDEYVGGPELIRDIWEYSSNENGFYSLWIGDALDSLGYDWDEAYEGFIAANTVMDYLEGGDMPTTKIEDKVTSFPASGGSSSSHEPEGYGQNYIRIKTTGANDAAPNLLVNFVGDSSSDWLVELVGTDGRTVVDTFVMPIGDTGIGELEFYRFGDYEYVWLVVSPLGNTSKSYSYEWEIDAVEGSGDLDTGDGGSDAVGGCGCSASGDVPSALVSWSWMVLFGLVISRRRKANIEVS